ncbi:MAG: hypothetical protein ACJ786_13655 [Catenulispora sp.]
MAFHCGAPTRDGSACQRHVGEPGKRCHQHRDPGGAALPPLRLALRTIVLEDPALVSGTPGWMSAHEETAPEMSDPTRILFGDQDEPEPAPARGAEPGGPARAEIPDDDLPRRRHPRPEAEVEPNKPLRPDRRGARIIEDYLRRHDRAEPDDVVEADLRRAHTAKFSHDDPDPDWIGVRPLFRDEVAARGAAALDEAGPAAEAGSISGPGEARSLFRDGAPVPVPVPVPDSGRVPEPDSARPPRTSPMRRVVLTSQSDAEDDTDPAPDPPGDPGVDPDPPTLVDLDLDLDSGPRPAPNPDPDPDPDPPTLIGPPIPLVPPDDLVVPDFVVPGFTAPAPKPPLRTVLSTVLGPELWQRCYTEWGPAHCVSLARVARAIDGLAPSAAAALRSTAGASMRWFGVSRERDELADLVAATISHPVGASDANQARTTRLYGAAICMALNIPLRRCACHHDLERDVSGDLIRLGLEELAGEVS